MKTKMKALFAVLCVAAVAVVSALGTLAYLTSEDSDVNTFTIGNVSLALEETDVDEDDDPHNNQYHVVPGGEYTKDPTVTVKAGSSEAYVRMIMTVKNAAAVQKIVDNEKHGLTDYADFLGGWDPQIWIYQDFVLDEENDVIEFEFRYHSIVDGFDETGEKQDIELEPLFTTLKIPGTVSREELEALGEDFAIVFEAHAIQAAGFTGNEEKNMTAEDMAWNSFEQQVKK